MKARDVVRARRRAELDTVTLPLPESRDQPISVYENHELRKAALNGH